MPSQAITGWWLATAAVGGGKSANAANARAVNAARAGRFGGERPRPPGRVAWDLLRCLLGLGGWFGAEGLQERC